jgi:hypothetical protein
MYAIYGNIYHQDTPNVSIYTMHGSYGILDTIWHKAIHSLNGFMDLMASISRDDPTTLSVCGFFQKPGGMGGTRRAAGTKCGVLGGWILKETMGCSAWNSLEPVKHIPWPSNQSSHVYICNKLIPSAQICQNIHTTVDMLIGIWRGVASLGQHNPIQFLAWQVVKDWLGESAVMQNPTQFLRHVQASYYIIYYIILYHIISYYTMWPHNLGVHNEPRTFSWVYFVNLTTSFMGSYFDEVDSEKTKKPWWMVFFLVEKIWLAPIKNDHFDGSLNLTLW